MAEGQKHTEEAWIYRLKHPTAVNAGISILGPEDQLQCRKVVAELDYRDGAEANARRIVACVNACAGVPSEELEAGLLNRSAESGLVREALDAIEKAQQMVSDLCQRRREWVMSIPARPDYAPDLVIADALRKAKAALAQHQATGQHDDGWSVKPSNLEIENEWRDGFNGEHYTYNTGRQSLFVFGLEPSEAQAIKSLLTEGNRIPKAQVNDAEGDAAPKPPAAKAAGEAE